MRLLLASRLLFLPLTVHAAYRGNLSANEFDPNSVANPFAASSPFSLNSDTNKFGRYRSPYSNQSATNPYAPDSPTNPYGSGWSGANQEESRIRFDAQPAAAVGEGFEP